MCLIACSDFNEGTFNLLLSILTIPPSAFSPWQDSQFFLKFARAAANSSGVALAVAAGDTVAVGVVVEYVGCVVWVQAKLKSATRVQKSASLLDSIISFSAAVRFLIAKSASEYS